MGSGLGCTRVCDSGGPARTWDLQRPPWAGATTLALCPPRRRPVWLMTGRFRVARSRFLGNGASPLIACVNTPPAPGSVQMGKLRCGGGVTCSRLHGKDEEEQDGDWAGARPHAVSRRGHPDCPVPWTKSPPEAQSWPNTGPALQVYPALDLQPSSLHAPTQRAWALTGVLPEDRVAHELEEALSVEAGPVDRDGVLGKEVGARGQAGVSAAAPWGLPCQGRDVTSVGRGPKVQVWMGKQGGGFLITSSVILTF